jgi:preprotein translocase subunit SecG
MFDPILALKIVQTILSVLLIVAVMLHSAKGEGIGAMGGGAKVFGSQKGVEAGLNRFASTIAVLWGLVGIVLAFLSYHK